jgi:acrylyl-CoA reductase (NADPH)
MDLRALLSADTTATAVTDADADTAVRALLLTRDGASPAAPPVATVVTLHEDALPAGTVTVAVHNSSLNYKDALILAGAPGLVRDLPHVPGIDLAGTVVDSEDASVLVGSEVLVTGCWLGERHWGGMATRARVPAAWVVVRPDGLDAPRAMALGTAGFTAQLASDALHAGGVTPTAGPVLVTGATGGVGSLTVHLLARAGHEVHAATGRADEPDVVARLHRLGATTVLARSELETAADRRLGSSRFAGAVDVVGGRVLAGALTLLQPGGVAAACGLAGDTALPTTVLPFIVRGVTLRGIDSVLHPMPARPAVWARLAAAVDPNVLAALTRTIGLAEVPAAAADLLTHGGRGRTVIDCAG